MERREENESDLPISPSVQKLTAAEVPNSTEADFSAAMKENAAAKKRLFEAIIATNAARDRAYYAADVLYDTLTAAVAQLTASRVGFTVEEADIPVDDSEQALAVADVLASIVNAAIEGNVREDSTEIGCPGANISTGTTERDTPNAKDNFDEFGICDLESPANSFNANEQFTSVDMIDFSKKLQSALRKIKKKNMVEMKKKLKQRKPLQWPRFKKRKTTKVTYVVKSHAKVVKAIPEFSMLDTTTEISTEEPEEHVAAANRILGEHDILDDEPRWTEICNDFGISSSRYSTFGRDY